MDPNDPIVTRIVIRRNQSLDRKGLVRVLAIVAVPVGGYVTLAAMSGWWPVLTFCVGVFLIFAAVLYGVMAAGRECEVVTVSAHHVVVESGRFRPRMRVVLDRYWTRVESRGGARPALALIARGAAVEIAAALAEPERKTLARRLRALVGSDAERSEPAPGFSAGDSAHEGGRG